MCKQTRREEFHAQMDQVVPWQALLALIRPHCPKTGLPGRQLYVLETMLRIHFLQKCYALSDPAAEEALYDTVSKRRFAKIGGVAGIPDETTILDWYITSNARRPTLPTSPRYTSYCTARKAPRAGTVAIPGCTNARK